MRRVTKSRTLPSSRSTTLLSCCDCCRAGIRTGCGIYANMQRRLLQGACSIAASQQGAILSLVRDGQSRAPGEAIFCTQSQYTRH